MVKFFSDQIAVMYLGQLVETADSAELFQNTLHPYSQALLSAIPRPKVPPATERIILKGELASPIEPKPGCRFAPRCIHAQDRCFQENPERREIGQGRFACCHCI